MEDKTYKNATKNPAGGWDVVTEHNSFWTSNYPCPHNGERWIGREATGRMIPCYCRIVNDPVAAHAELLEIGDQIEKLEVAQAYGSETRMRCREMLEALDPMLAEAWKLAQAQAPKTEAETLEYFGPTLSTGEYTHLAHCYNFHKKYNGRVMSHFRMADDTVVDVPTLDALARYGLIDRTPASRNPYSVPEYRISKLGIAYMEGAGVFTPPSVAPEALEAQLVEERNNGYSPMVEALTVTPPDYPETDIYRCTRCGLEWAQGTLQGNACPNCDYCYSCNNTRRQDWGEDGIHNCPACTMGDNGGYPELPEYEAIDPVAAERDALRQALGEVFDKLDPRISPLGTARTVWDAWAIAHKVLFPGSCIDCTFRSAPCELHIGMDAAGIPYPPIPMIGSGKEPRFLAPPTPRGRAQARDIARKTIYEGMNPDKPDPTGECPDCNGSGFVLSNSVFCTNCGGAGILVY